MQPIAIVDADTHVLEPPDLWTSRLPEKWGDQRMHVKWDERRSAECWYIGDQYVTEVWATAQFGWEDAQGAAPSQGWVPSGPKTRAEAHPACYEADARVATMEEGGVRAAVLYSNIAGIFDPFSAHPDRDLSLAHVRAYNDFVIDWIEDTPRRFVANAVIPYWDVPAAVAEIERAAAMGHRGIATTAAPQEHGQPYLGDHHWDPIWAACQAAGLPIAFHAANGDFSDHVAPQRVAVDGPAVTIARGGTAVALDNAQQLNDLLLCGVLARFPDLEFISVESALGWVPFVLESADYHFKKFRLNRVRPEFGDLLPSELFRRQVYVNFWFEEIQPWHVAAIGVDNILFGTDFPHPTHLSGGELADTLDRLGTLDPDVQEKILWRNAARLYDLECSDSGPIIDVG